MKEKTKKKLMVGALSCIMVTLSCVSASYNASASGKGNDVTAQSYKGIIKKERINTQFDMAYRDTTKSSDPFFVKLSTSTEGGSLEKGKGTVTRFWLENDGGDNLSNTVDVTQGKGYYRRNPYQSGCGRKVYLTGENNNYNKDQYVVTGKWKEE